MEKQKENEINTFFIHQQNSLSFMKKMIIACAVVLAACLSSCGDTNYCYEVTVKTNVLVETSTTHYFWGTSNELDAFKDELRKGQEAIGISKDAIEITAKRTSKSASDCY